MRGRSVSRRAVCAAGVAALCALLLAAPNGSAEDKSSEGVRKTSPGSLGTPVPPAPKDAPSRPASPDETVPLEKDLPEFRSVEDDAPIRSADENEDEHRAYNYTLAHARRQSPEALARNALRDVPFANLVKPIRQDYLRELIHIEGQLHKLTVFKATKFLKKTEDVRELYEGWVTPRDEPFPLCILFTDLPTGLKPAPKFENTWVSFDGYYFKLMRYETNEVAPSGKHLWRQAPLLIGRSPVLEKPPADAAPLSFSGTLFPAIIGLVAAVGAVAIALTWWFRREDRRVRSRVEQTQYQTNPFQQAPPAVEPGAGWDRPGPSTA